MEFTITKYILRMLDHHVVKEKKIGKNFTISRYSFVSFKMLAVLCVIYFA